MSITTAEDTARDKVDKDPGSRTDALAPAETIVAIATDQEADDAR